MHISGRFAALRAQVTWRRLAYAAVILISVLFLWAGNRLAARNMYVFGGKGQAEVAPASVDLILARDARPLFAGDREMESVIIYFEATFTSGPRAGMRVGARQINDPFAPVMMREVEEGDRVTLVYAENDGEKMWMLQEYVRTGPLLILGICFLALLLLFGGKKGWNTIVSLCFTCLSIFTVLFPLILAGYNIYISTLAVCLYIVAMTLALVNGLNRKSLSALAGCLGGVLVAGALVKLMDGALKLTGFIDEESAFLMYMNPDNPIDLKALIFSAILIGALGATLDVAVSMAASLSEIHDTSPQLGFSALVASGFNIGRDILGTMTNTLVLAYIGGSMPILLLLIVYSNSVAELLNREMIVVEILQAIVGSIGLLAAIPLTTLCAAYILSRRRKQADANTNIQS